MIPCGIAAALPNAKHSLHNQPAIDQSPDRKGIPRRLYTRIDLRIGQLVRGETHKGIGKGGRNDKRRGEDKREPCIFVFHILIAHENWVWFSCGSGTAYLTLGQ